jgi:hypothetical protein
MRGSIDSIVHTWRYGGFRPETGLPLPNPWIDCDRYMREGRHHMLLLSRLPSIQSGLFERSFHGN